MDADCIVSESDEKGICDGICILYNKFTMIFLIQQIIFTEKYVAHKNNDKWVFLYPNLQMIIRRFLWINT